IYHWAVGVGVQASRVRQQRKQPSRWLSWQLAVADRLVLRTIRERLGGRIRFFVSGSAPLSRDVAEWFDAVGMTILEGYGLTESTAAASINLPNDTRIGTVGPAMPGSEFKIADDGEILLRGGGVMRGYHHQPQATAEALTEDGWLHTGDIGELVDGYLRVTDRKKDLIKTSGGKYIAPQKVEGIFKALCPYASQIIVHGEGRNFVSALITLDAELIVEWAGRHHLAGKTPEELATEPAVLAMIGGHVGELNKRLERWETIKKFVIVPHDLTVEDGELTPSMKVRRKVVERKYMTDLDQLYLD
ncbi:MAG TPA: AMP-binding protein, partial [Nakamurella sp.]